MGDVTGEELHQDGGKSELPGAQIVSLIQSYFEKEMEVQQLNFEFQWNTLYEKA